MLDGNRPGEDALGQAIGATDGGVLFKCKAGEDELVPGEDARGQAIGGVVGSLQDLLLRVEGQDGHDGPKDLLLHTGHVIPTVVCEHRIVLHSLIRILLMAKYIYTYRKLTWCGWCIGHKTHNIPIK